MILENFKSILEDDRVYRPDEITEVIVRVRPNFRLAYNNTKVKYFNVPAAFDIETSSFRTSGNEKSATMYEWTFGIYGAVFIGRTWEQFVTLMTKLSEILKLHDHKRLIVYVHNLAFEFQFFRKWFLWDNVFSLTDRKPVYALSSMGIEYRCSYILSGYSLAKIGENLSKYKVKKMVGDLDYDLLRHSMTPLTTREIGYCVNDVKVDMAYIAEEIERVGGIAAIPLTKTGYVRQFCRNSCFYDPKTPKKKSFKRLRYMDIMRGLRLTPDEYKQLKRAFQGGFTHANPWKSGKIVEDVTSFDFTSSYPTVMIAEQFPMSSSVVIDLKTDEEFEKSLRLYCCVFDVEFFDLESQILSDSYISESRCWGLSCTVVNNGRIVSADHLCTTITEQDYKIIKKMYKWKKMRIYHFRRYKKGYLPTDFVRAILKLYGDKTTLKGVEGKEVEYLKSKEMLNSCYGMTVTDIVRAETVYADDEWQDPIEPDAEKEIIKYNNNGGRFLFYPWGVWVTAYARRNLFSGILEFGSDYIYSDTDSIKVKNAEKHRAYIDKYNDLITRQLLKALEFHGIEADAIAPKTVDGVKKPLGVWDFDGHYRRFKTLGAKRYLVEYSDDPRNKKKDRGRIQMTVSGLNKQTCVPYICTGWRYTLDGKEIGTPFDVFADDMYIPPEYTGKMTHTYIDEEESGELTDYLGNVAHWREKSSIHLEKSDYSLSLSREYLDYILGLEDEYI